MRALVVVSILAVAAVVSADTHELAEGYELIDDGTRVDVRKGKRRATLVAGAGIVTDSLAVDAKKRKIAFEEQRECGTGAQELTLDQLEARLVNHESLVLHRKKDWANAAKGFAKAVQLDPTWRLPAYNLASAHARLGATAPALAALAPWLKAEPIATFVQVASDPELQPLLSLPELAAVRAGKPGTFTLGTGRVPPLYSAEKKLVAIYVPQGGYLGCDGPSQLVVHDTVTGKLVASIVLEPCKATKDQRASRKAVVGAILTALGFAPAATEDAALAAKDESSDKRIGRFPNAKLGVVTNKSGGINVLRDGKPVATVTPRHDRVHEVTYLSEAKLVFVQSYLPSDMCARYDVDVAVVPDGPPGSAKKR